MGIRTRGWVLALLLASLVPAACRAVDPDTRTLHSLGLRQVDVVTLAEAVVRDVERTVEADGRAESRAIVHLEVANETALAYGPWRSLGGALAHELLAAAESRPFRMTLDPAAPASHRLALSVRETGALNDRELSVHYRIERASREDGAPVQLAEAEHLLPRH